MRLIARLACMLILATLISTARAQDISERERDRPRRADQIPTEGFWPTQKMMDRFIDRIIDGMADEYNFDDSQLELTRQLFKARFPEFLNENRAEIQTLLNQYFEALLDDRPPAVEDVADWAGRVQPLMTEFGEVCTEVAEGMREYLNDDQTVMLDAQYVTFQAGMKMAQNKLAIWADGGYDPETEWIHQGSRQHGRQDSQAAEGDATAEAETAAARPAAKDDWTIYTEQFIERYELNDEQKQKAFTFLRHQQEARDRYLRRNVDEMARVTRLLTEAETEEERAASLEAYQRLNAPVDRLFEQLKQRLDTLPTRAQRKAAIEAGRVAEEEAEPPILQGAPTPETAPSREEVERLEELGYVRPSASQPTGPQP
jgi:hypothetical protein